MYSEAELNGAVEAGVLTRDSADAFRAHVAASRHAPIVDEEQFRLITGFNDIFVVIAIALGFVALGQLGGRTGALFIAAGAWALAEFFTRRRRMALPSIVLVAAFVIGLFAGTMALLDPNVGRSGGELREEIAVLIAAAVAIAGAVAHWVRFRVPITVAIITAAGTVALLSAILAALDLSPETLGRVLPWIVLAAGLAIFAFAMRWDVSDPTRQTRRADVAFWLHLLAAPMTAHPIFLSLGLVGGGVLFGGFGEGDMGGASAWSAVAAVALYLVFGFVAVVIDRRALLVSGLAYVLYAFYRLVQTSVSVELGFALSALVIASALLLLSAFWTNVRAAVLAALPDDLRARLPHSIALTASA